MRTMTRLTMEMPKKYSPGFECAHTMKAIRFESYGSPSVLTMKEIPMPVLQKGEVLIQIKAAAINPSDVKIVAGIIKASLPRVPGRDYAGVVVDGEAKKGMEVWGSGA